MLKEAEAGLSTADLCRKHGITYYNWKSKYDGMSISKAKKQKQMEDENLRLKQIVEDLTLDNQALKAVISKNF